MPVVLITGASRATSIAAGIVPRLVADGWDVATSDLAAGDYPSDLSNAQEASALIGAVTKDKGPIEALVLSHAHGIASGVLDTTAESLDLHLAINVRASLLLIAEFARQAPSCGGAIVAMTSDHATGNLPYGASKGALDRILIAAARELGPAGVSANLINPGPIDTGWMDDETRESVEQYTPLGRLGTPRDIAGVVSFLLSAEGRWVSGQLLHTDGAYSARY